MTTFAVVAGSRGADLGAGVVVVLGCANLLGDGLSMAAGNFLAVRAEAEQRARTRARELEHIALLPEGEREEVRQIFARQGFAGAELETVVARITSDVERWVDTMLHHEHGLARQGPSPWRAASTMFVAFVLAGSLPLLAFLPGVLGLGEVPREPFLWSSLLTAVTFAAVGAAKGRAVDRPAWRTALETLLVGGLAASAAYGVGALLRDWLGAGL